MVGWGIDVIGVIGALGRSALRSAGQRCGVFLDSSALPDS